jgi:hypothetical protein
MAERSVPPPPDHQDKPIAEDSKASVGQRITGVPDANDPDGLLTLDDVDKVKGMQDRPVPPDTTSGVTAAGAAPSGDLPERVVGGDAPNLGSVNSGGDSLGDDTDLPTPDGTSAQTPWAKQQGIGEETP